MFHSERAGIRTPDNLIKSQVLYQLSYTPLFNYIPFNYKENAQSRNRTSDTRIFSPLLYQLSYLGKSFPRQGARLGNFNPEGTNEMGTHLVGDGDPERARTVDL